MNRSPKDKRFLEMVRIAKMSEAEKKFRSDIERLAAALKSTEPESLDSTVTEPERQMGTSNVKENRERFDYRKYWGRAKLKAAGAFAAVTSVSFAGSFYLHHLVESAQQTLNTTDVLDPMNQSALANLGNIQDMPDAFYAAPFALAFAIPALMLGLAKLRERGAQRKVEGVLP